MRISKRLIAYGTLLAVTLCIGAAYIMMNSSEPSDQAVKLMRHQTSTDVVDWYLPDGPLPTNKWFSNLVFSQEQPVYAYPWSFQKTNTGFEVGYTKPVARPQVVTAAHTNRLSFDFERETTMYVAAYDSLSVELVFRSGTAELAKVRLTQGSPMVFIETPADRPLTAKFPALATQRQDYAEYTHDTVTYGVSGGDMKAIDRQRYKLTSQFAAYIVPSGGDKSLYRKAAKNPISATSATFRKQSGKALLNYSLSTENGGPTLWAHPYINYGADKPSLKSIVGDLTFAQVATAEVSVRELVPQHELDLSALSDVQRSTLTKQISEDINTTSIRRTDTYFASKELYRLANLLQLADQLNVKPAKQTAQDLLKRELSLWTDITTHSRTNKYFYYDTTYGGIVGKDASFGSESFNDHHFHYGYFIYAASVLAEHDKQFAKENRAVIDALAHDIASSTTTATFPQMRHFDFYLGHSWASGMAPFFDGNNQESSSEAVLAWASLYRWYELTGQTSNRKNAQQLYSFEAERALTRWLSGTAQSEFPGYEHPFVSLVWGGKLDYATWFSAEDSAKLGIQLIPLSPAHSYVKQAKVWGANPSTVGTQFQDYIAMADPRLSSEEAAAAVKAIQASQFDNANSASYALAWIYSQHKNR